MDSFSGQSYVHIIPLGYEIDRAIRPFDSEPVTRVYVLTMKQMEKYNTPEEVRMTARERHFETKVLKYLENKGIEVNILQIDMFSTLEVMNTVASIINQEKNNGAVIKVNMSACGRITTFAATLAAMANDVPLYYVRADRYAEKEEDVIDHGLSICEQNRVWELEQLPVHLPQNARMSVITMLAQHPDGLYTWEIVDNLVLMKEPGYSEPFRSKKPDEMRKIQRRYHTKLNKSTLSPLEAAGYITQQKCGRYHRVTITKSGLYLAAAHGNLPEQALKKGVMSEQ